MLKAPHTNKQNRNPKNKQAFDRTDDKENTYNTMSGTSLNNMYIKPLNLQNHSTN